MSAKKNKKTKKPAVGKPAAGSNNKREKSSSQHNENDNRKKNNSGKPVQKSKTKAVNSSKNSTGKNSKKAISEKGKAPQKKPEKNIASKKKNRKEETVIQKIIESEQNTAASIENFKKNYNMLKVGVALGLAAVLIAGAVVLVVSLCRGNVSLPDYVKDVEYKGRTEPESIAFRMNMSDNQQNALAKATKSKGDRRAFDFFVNDNIVMNEYDEPALIEFGSVDSNDCVLIFLMFDENGNEIYRSLGVEPGRQVKSITFFDELSYGSHEITLAVMGYDAKTYETVGMQTAKINLEIGVD